MPKADRLFALVQFLSGARRRSVDDLVSELGTTRRTVFRDLNHLEERGVPIERTDGRYRIVQGAVVHALPLSDRERLLLAILLDMPSVARQPAFHAALQQLRTRLRTMASEETAVAARMAGPERSGEVSEEIVRALEKAIHDARSVSILYTSLSEARPKPKWRSVDPWALMHRSEAWYLVGRCHENDEARTFRLDRIESVLEIGAAFERPAFEASQWFANAWGAFRADEAEEVVIVFEEQIAPLIAHAQHHPTEEKRRLPDGRLEYRVRIAPLDEIARWIAGFGGNAVAIAPEELVTRVRSLAAGVTGAHEEKGMKRSARKVADRKRE